MERIRATVARLTLLRRSWCALVAIAVVAGCLFPIATTVTIAFGGTAG
ncbi:MAG: hypothetical protein ACFBWO_03385 [Paracoccaceae bacterium]